MDKYTAQLVLPTAEAALISRRQDHPFVAVLLRRGVRLSSVLLKASAQGVHQADDRATIPARREDRFGASDLGFDKVQDR